MNRPTGAIRAKIVIYNFERLMDNAKLLKCLEFAHATVEHMAD